MPFVVFDKNFLDKAVEKHGENVVKDFSASTFKEIVKTSPQKDTVSPSGRYHRTGGLRDGWDIKSSLKGGYVIINDVAYAPYYEYGHRLSNGNVAKGNYLMSNAVDTNLKKFGLRADRKGEK